MALTKHIKTSGLTILISTSLLNVACSDKTAEKAYVSPLPFCDLTTPDSKLDTSNIQLTREQNIPLMYQGYNNIEGPVWHDGALYYSNMGTLPADENTPELSNQTTIWRWQPGSNPEVWMTDKHSGTNGLALDSKGNLIGARQLDGSISKISWKDKSITPITTQYQGKRFNSPNDLVLSQDDRIYFTDPNWNTPSNIDLTTTQISNGGLEGQDIYHVAQDGTVAATNITDLVPELHDKPNGITLSLDEKQIIVGGLKGLWAFDIDQQTASNPQQLLDTPIDGLGKDCTGNIYITTTRNKPHRADAQFVVVLDKNYREIAEIEVDGIHIVTNVAFGGEDRRTLFVTSLTALMDGDKVRMCGDKPCLEAGIYTAQLNVQGFAY